MRPRLLPALLFALLAMAWPAAARAGSMLSAAGAGPSIAVDASGTGHVAWFTEAGSAFPYTYQLAYCKLPRGATACAGGIKLFNTPNNANPFGRTQVLVNGSRVIILGDLYGGTPTLDGIYSWESANSGGAFAAAKLVAAGADINQAIFGPGTNSISAVNDVAGSIKYVYGSLSSGPVGSFQVGAGQGLGSQAGQDIGSYSDVGLLNAQTPYVVMSNGGSYYLRRFNATKSGFATAASWWPSQLITNANASIAAPPRTAFGVNGAFVGYESSDYVDGGYPYAIRRIGDDVTGSPTISISAPQYVTRKGANPIDAAFREDDSGRLHLAYQDNHDDNRLYYQWSKRGTGWSEPIALSGVNEPDGYDNQIGVAPDGGGWVVAQDHGGAVNPIRVFAFAPKGASEDPNWDPNATPPGPNTTPTPTPAPVDPCPATVTVATGILAKVRTGDCFKDVSKTKGSKSTPAGTIWQTSGSVRVNGVDFTAPSSGTFTVDAKAHTVDAKGAYKVQAGSVVLATGSRTWDVTKTVTVNGLSAFGVKLFGLPVSGNADLAFDSQGAGITINVDLPYPVNVVHGRTTLRTTMAAGLIVDGVQIKADTVPIGPLELRNLNIEYSGQNDAFEGHAEVYLPPAAKAGITAGFGLQEGAFKHAEFEIGSPTPPFPLPLWGAPPITLNRVGFAASVNDEGFKLAGGVQLVLGTEIAGMTPLAIDALPSSGGGASLFIPKSGSYAEIAASGKLTVLDLPIATGSVNIRTDGPVTFKGGTDIDFAIISIGVHYEGGLNLSNGDFYAAGDGSACADFIDLEGCAKVQAILSSIGIGACGSLKLTEKLTGLHVSVGLGADRPWGGSLHIGDCRIDSYKPASLGGPGGPPPSPKPAATINALNGPATVSLPSGDVAGVRVTGTSGKPGFTFGGVGDRTITVPANLTKPVSNKSIIAIPAEGNTVELQVLNPEGVWTIAPDATQSQAHPLATPGPLARRAATVASVETAKGLPTPKVSGSVRKLAGRSRQLTVRASNLGDQQLLVRELLPGGAANELGKVKGNGTTVLRFTPTDGPGGKRTIQAVVITKDGRQVGTPTVATYTAPGPVKLSAPKRVTLSRSKTALTVRWTKVTGAARYRVIVTATDGRKEIITVEKGSKLQIPAVTADDKVTVKVAGVSKLGIQGAAKSSVSKATKKTTKKTSSKKK